MESLYYVVSYVCHRRCSHCYEERFRPYQGAALAEQVQQATRAAPRIIDHLPEEMTYLDRSSPRTDGALPRRRGRVILAGGEALHPAVREPVTYAALERLAARYRARGGVNLVVQTTGDLLTDAIVAELLRRGVWMISVAGLDAYHAGLEEPAARARLRDQLTALFLRHGMRPTGHQPERRWCDEDGPTFSFFGATPDSWIGKIWPRGRAWQHGLSRATLADNFCAAWSGGLRFLDLGFEGAEVSIDPDGDVYPCCLKTRRPLGNLQEEPLVDILRSLRGDPAFEAISAGAPQRMGLTHGWSEARFLARCQTQTPGGLPYANLCIGCDRFHEEVLGPRIEELKAQRGASRGAARDHGTEGISTSSSRPDAESSVQPA